MQRSTLLVYYEIAGIIMGIFTDPRYGYDWSQSWLCKYNLRVVWFMLFRITERGDCRLQILFSGKTIASNTIALREESSQTNVILQYKLLASILSVVCSVIQQS